MCKTEISQDGHFYSQNRNLYYIGFCGKANQSKAVKNIEKEKKRKYKRNQ